MRRKKMHGYFKLKTGKISRDNLDVNIKGETESSEITAWNIVLGSLLIKGKSIIHNKIGNVG